MEPECDKKPTTYLKEGQDSLFFKVHCQPDGTVILTSTRHKGSVIILSDLDVQRISQEPFFFKIPESFLDENLPEKHSLSLYFDETEESAGAKILHVSN